MYFGSIGTSLGGEYTFDELINFHKFGIGFGINWFVPQKEFIRQNYDLQSPYFNLNLNFNHRIFDYFITELNLSYYKLQTFRYDTLHLEIPEANLMLFHFLNLGKKLYMETGIGAGFSSALATTMVETISTNQITVGKRELTKVKYGYNLIFGLNFRKYLDEYNSLLLVFKYNYSQIGNPKKDGFGNLGGFKVGVAYNYNF